MKKEIKTILFNLFGYFLLPGMFILSYITNNEVIMWIAVGMLAIHIVAILGWLFINKLIEPMSTIVSWSYEYDKQYHGYSIQANRKLFGRKWNTNEYISNTEEEAKKIVECKNLR